MTVSGRSTPPYRPEAGTWLSSALWVFQNGPRSDGLADTTGLGAGTPRVPFTHLAAAAGAWKEENKNTSYYNDN